MLNRHHGLLLGLLNCVAPERASQVQASLTYDCTVPWIYIFEGEFYEQTQKSSGQKMIDKTDLQKTTVDLKWDNQFLMQY